MDDSMQSVGGHSLPVERIGLDRGSPIPLYLQIKQFLVRRIAQWEGQGGENQGGKFYTDGELCDMFAVSRMTVRQAVQELVDEGRLKRARGVGTFVVARQMEAQPATFGHFPERWVESGRPVRLELLSFDTRPCPASFAEDLGIAANAPVRYIFRLRAAGAVHIALDHRFVPLAYAGAVTQADAATSILRTYWDRFEMSHAEIRLEATTAGQQEVRWLDVPLGAPMMVRRMRYMTTSGLAVLAGFTVYRADIVRYAIEMPLSKDTLEPAARGEDHTRSVTLRREMIPPEHDA